MQYIFIAYCNIPDKVVLRRKAAVGKQIDVKDIVEKLKKEKGERANVTFRISVAVAEKFKQACKKQGLSNSDVIEEFMRRFIESI